MCKKILKVVFRAEFLLLLCNLYPFRGIILQFKKTKKRDWKKKIRFFYEKISAIRNDGIFHLRVFLIIPWESISIPNSRFLNSLQPIAYSIISTFLRLHLFFFFESLTRIYKYRFYLLDKEFFYFKLKLVNHLNQILILKSWYSICQSWINWSKKNFDSFV